MTDHDDGNIREGKMTSSSSTSSSSSVSRAATSIKVVMIVVAVLFGSLQFFVAVVDVHVYGVTDDNSTLKEELLDLYLDDLPEEMDPATSIRTTTTSTVSDPKYTSGRGAITERLYPRETPFYMMLEGPAAPYINGSHQPLCWGPAKKRKKCLQAIRNHHDRGEYPLASIRDAPPPDAPLVFPKSKEPHAVCNYQLGGGWRQSAFHFPHAMQQLYRCFSWLVANPEKFPVLLMTGSTFTEEHKRTLGFLWGFLTALRDIFGVDIVQHPDSIHQAADVEHYKAISAAATIQNSNEDMMLKAFELHHPRDAAILRQALYQHYNITNNNQQDYERRRQDPALAFKRDLAGCPASPATTAAESLSVLGFTFQNRKKQVLYEDKTFPVIGFLNRVKKREVQNVRDIIQALETKYPHTKIHFLPSFDGMSFLQQITYMSQVDILVGPHGAQLTSVLFMPECGGLIEIFPREFYMPHYYGSLARASGLFYWDIFTGNLTTKEFIESHMYGDANFQFRKKRRDFKSFPNPAHIVEAVEKVVAQWQTCCRTGRRR